MTLSQQLAQLQELPPPPLPSFWPQTWGWGLLLALLMGILGRWLWQRWRDRRNNRYRREALAELQQLEQRWRQQPHELTPLRQVPSVLKRAVLAVDPAANSGPLTGTAWQHQLQQRAREPLPANFAEQLATLAYHSDIDVQTLELPRLLRLCRRWLETHDATP